ncbi:MAG: tRNA (adenosine(37)-N6)-threonylcarbamoyltransferase complex dimerization subunit type 1 TsaB [Phototrophicaceae bacterium]
MLIAIDTATKYLGLALYDEQTLIAEQMWRTGNKHNALLAPSIQQLLDTCSVNTSDLTMVAVANGPGSYTGLRIGVAMAKGLAAVKQLPLIGVNTLDIIANGQNIDEIAYPLLCVLPAGRKRIIVGEYRYSNGQWQASTDPQTTTWDDLLASLEAKTYHIAGEIEAVGLKAIESFSNDAITLKLVSVAHRGRRMAVLAEVAWQTYYSNNPDDFLPAKLAPMYLTEPG